MKKFKMILALVAFFAALSLTSCNQDSSPLSADSSTSQNSALVSGIFYENPTNVISPVGVTFNNDIVEFDGISKRDRNGYGPLGYALSRLTLTADQIAGIQAAATAYIDCVTQATATVRDAEKAIMDKLKTDVKAITDQVRAGTLDRTAARDQILALKEAAKLAIEAIPGRAEAKAAAEACFATYNTAVRALLTADQITALDAAIANRGTGSGHGKDDGKGHGKGHGKGDDKGHGKGGMHADISGPLGHALSGLGLDSNQINSAKALAVTLKDCYTAAMGPIFEQEKVIMDALKATREQIMADLKAGTIDQATAKANWVAAETTAKTAMANIPGRTEAEAAAKLCYDNYLASVKALLTPEQLAALEKILASGGVRTKP
jgi:hypothetical protein